MTAVVPIEKAKPAVEARPERVGVLLVNLGTPDSADAKGIRAKLYVAPTLMTTLEDREALARTVLDFADSLA